MADFKISFSAGVAAAVLATENKNEIYSLISDVDKQLADAYDGKVHFGIWTFKKKKRKKDAVANIFMDALNYDTVEFDALSVANYDSKEPISLVEFKVTENGYPCILKYEDREAYCYDKEDFVTELSTLLSDVKTGKAILKQINDFSNKQKVEE